MKEIDRAGAYFLRAILRRMKELGFNQTTFARHMNASRPYVVNVLHGEVSVTLRSAARFAARFAYALYMDFLPVLKPKPNADSRNCI